MVLYNVPETNERKSRFDENEKIQKASLGSGAFFVGRWSKFHIPFIRGFLGREGMVFLDRPCGFAGPGVWFSWTKAMVLLDCPCGFAGPKTLGARMVEPFSAP